MPAVQQLLRDCINNAAASVDCGSGNADESGARVCGHFFLGVMPWQHEVASALAAPRAAVLFSSRQEVEAARAS